MAEVKLKNITKKYGDVTAVQNMNLDIPHNEFLVLVGPSGCGKSTTLRMIAGLVEEKFLLEIKLLMKKIQKTETYQWFFKIMPYIRT